MSNKDIYLVAFYSMKPKRHVRTEVAGWMKDPNNIRWDESVEITRGLKKNSVNGKILLNLSQKRIEKNGWADGKEFTSKKLASMDCGSKQLLPRILWGRKLFP